QPGGEGERRWAARVALQKMGELRAKAAIVAEAHKRLFQLLERRHERLRREASAVGAVVSAAVRVRAHPPPSPRRRTARAFEDPWRPVSLRHPTTHRPQTAGNGGS